MAFPGAGTIKGGEGITETRNWGYPERSWGHRGDTVAAEATLHLQNKVLV